MGVLRDVMRFWRGVGMGRSSAFTRIVLEAHLWVGLRGVRYPRWWPARTLGSGNHTLKGVRGLSA